MPKELREYLESLTPNNVGGAPRRIDHGLLRGLILNEVVRRVDEQGRTIGQIVEQEFARPLGLGRQDIIMSGRGGKGC